MPVYEYQGKHYDLPEGLTVQQAKAKIQTHLAGEQSKGLMGKVADGIGGVAETLTTGAVDMFGGLAAQGLAVGDALVNGKDVSQARDQMAEAYGESDAHKLLEPKTDSGKWIGEKIGHAVDYWKDKMPEVGDNLAHAFLGQTADANPEIGRTVAALGSALPEASALGLPGAAPKGKGFKFKEKEKRGIDAKATMAELEAGQDRPTLNSRKPGSQGELFEPSNEGLASPYDAGQAGITEPINPKLERRQMDLPFGMDTMPVTKEGQGILSPIDAMAREKYEAEMRARKVAEMTNETQQVPLFDHPSEGRPPAPHEAVTGDWRVDENGMPIKADLSMEAQNLENPRQRNLFGDELPQKHPQEAPTGYMQSMADTAGALDRSRSFESFDRLKQMQEEQNALLRGHIEADGRLEAAKLSAEIMDPQVRGGDPKMGFNFRKQGGAVNMDVMKEGFQKLKQLADGTWLRVHNDGTMLHVDAIKDGHKLGHVEMAPEYVDRLHSDERNMKAYMTHVRADQRGKGYAQEMYKFVAELGNDVQRSESQTPAGKAMWDKFHEKGLAKKGVIPKKQLGAINPEVFKEGFKKLISRNGVDYIVTSRPHDNPQLQSIQVQAHKNGEKVGDYTFGPKGDNLYAWGAETLPSERRKGIASDAYDVIRSLGNDIVPSTRQSADGKAFWNGQVKSPGNKEQGAIFMKPKDENSRKVLDNIPGIEKTLKTMAPNQWTPKDAIEAAKNAPEMKQNAVQQLSNYFTKGGLYMKHRVDGNPIVRYAVDKVMQAERKTRADIANILHDKDYGLGAITRNMTADEQRNIWSLVNWADHQQHELTPAFLKEKGATEAQIKYVETHRKVMDYAHEQMNKVMEATGKPPVSKRQAYAAMNASGDYRRLVYKGEDVVGMIGSDLRWRVDGLKNELEKKGYRVGEERYVGGKTREMGDATREMAQMLEWFADNDPRVQELLATVAEATSSMARNFMNMEVHTKAKKGIFGFDGRKTTDGIEWGGTVLTRDKALANAREGLKAQMNYAEMAIKWGHLAEAAKDVKEVTTSKELSNKQQLAKQWTNQYLQHAMGHNPTVGRYLEQWGAGLAGMTGVGYSNFREGVAVSRRVVNSLLLGLNPGFWYTNVIQPLQAMPGMKASLVAKGLDASFDLGTGYAYVGKGAMDAYRAAREPGKLEGVMKEAYNYARENHAYGSDLIEHSNHVHKGFSYQAERISSGVAGSIESGTRATMFYGFTRMLHENGMSPKNGLFEAAHNLTDMAMNNYSRTERPMAYDVIGPIGELASNLSSYKHNELSRMAMFARDMAQHKEFRPLVAQILSTVAYSGIKGIVGYNAANELVKYISSALGKPTSLTRELMLLSQGMGSAGTAVTHGGFSLIGLDMSNRLGLGDALTPNLFPGGSKLAQLADKGIDLAKNRDVASLADFGREAAPGIAQGPLDLTLFSHGDIGQRRDDWAGQVKRTQGDKVAKAIGLTGIHESLEKSKNYENRWIDKVYADKRKSVLDTIKGEYSLTGKVSPANVNKYLAARGTPDNLRRELDRIKIDQNTTAKDRDLKKSLATKSVAGREHAKDILETDK